MQPNKNRMAGASANKEKGSVSVYFVQSALEPVKERGLDAGQLLREAGIAPAVLLSPQGRVSARQFGDLWRGVATVLDDELFGQDARRVKVGSFAMMCRALVHCATLGQAMDRMARFFNLLLDDFHSSLERDGHLAYLTIRRRAGASGAGTFGYETLLMIQHGVACWLIGRRIPVLAAAFAYPEPSRSAEYSRMYSEQLRFDQAATALSFERTYLDLPVIQDDKTVKDFVRQAPANIVLKYKNSSGLAAQLRRRLRAAAHIDWPGFATYAQSLNLTPSTLRRRLEEEGQSFQIIKDQLRRDLAIEYLCHTATSVTEIASELGFSEPSAFHRAFKKWTGANPGAYRKRMQQP